MNPRIVYVNGAYVAETEACISIFDRGFLMADGVYEVTSVLGGKLLDYGSHLKRLHRSLGELEVVAPCSDDTFLQIHRELISANRLESGVVYVQITRGNAGDRSFLFPGSGMRPTLVAFTQSIPDLVNSPLAERGARVISIPDLRWGRRDIKTVQLLYPSMGKMMAHKAGADDSWLVEGGGVVTEGTSHNVYIVKGQKIITRHLSHGILHGVTRAAVLRFAKEAQFEVEERSFTIAEAQFADEAFATAASVFVLPVIEVDGVKIGAGVPGPVARRLRKVYLEEMCKTAI